MKNSKLNHRKGNDANLAIFFCESCSKFFLLAFFFLAIVQGPLSAQNENNSKNGDDGDDGNEEIAESLNYFRNKKKSDSLVGSAANLGSGSLLLDATVLKDMAVYSEGRVMPFDSYAQNTLLILNGKSTMRAANGVLLSASDWLARVMFTPAETLDDEVFKIVFPEALHAIGLSQQKSRRYSFNTLAQRLPQIQQLATFAEKIPAEKRSPIEKEFLRIYDSYVRYYRVLSAFLFALPTETFRFNSKEVAETLGLSKEHFQRNNGVYSYLQVMEVSEKLLAWGNSAASKPERLRSAEDLMAIEMRGRYLDFPATYSSLPIKILPSFSHDEEKWFSVWQLFVIAKGQNIIEGEVDNLKKMIESYRLKDAIIFEKYAVSFKKNISERLGVANKPIENKVKVEALYNSLNPFYRAMLAYFFAIPLLMPFFVGGNSSFIFLQKLNYARVKNFFYLACAVLLAIGVVLSLVGVGMRMYITDRPPITNLYTTFIFVSVVSAMLCLGLERFFRGGFGLLSGAISAGVMLLISMRFAAEGDTMNVLVAVLRSNFWLSTHVITINLGYAGIVLSGIIAHVLLFYSLKQKKNSTSEKKLMQMVYATQAFGLLFTVVGTLLGGIWADQSWGRFWGWDPKENGSLLIVLWSAMAFHARFSGMVKNVGFAALAVVGIMVVMVAWFGINLLGVGLHSYGFTSGIAYPLFLYLSLQSVLLFLLLYFLEMKKSMAKNIAKQ